jgi:hypothetical protein
MSKQLCHGPKYHIIKAGSTTARTASGLDHFRWIDDAVEQLLRNEAELQRGGLQGQVVDA